MAAAAGALLFAPPPPSPAARYERPPAPLSHARIPSARRPAVGPRRKREVASRPGVSFAVVSSPRTRAESSAASIEPMTPPYNVLITGSTKGIGYALAKEFLKAGDNVVICSRSAERVKSAVQDLRQEFGEQHVFGTKCDVREGHDVKSLVGYAQEKLKYIDLWINNAGSNAYSYKALAESSDEDLLEVVTTNSLGLMLCCREAIKMMLSQPRGGHIFNMDGAGADGRPTPRFAAYGATKRSVVHLTKSLQAELQMQDVKNVLVHNLSDLKKLASIVELIRQIMPHIEESDSLSAVESFEIHNGLHKASCLPQYNPGMVTTDLLMCGATTNQVAKYLVPNIRSVPTNGSQKPTYIRFLTGIKAYTQIFSRIAFGARRNRYILED